MSKVALGKGAAVTLARRGASACLAAEPQADCGEVEAVGAAEAAEQLEVRAGAAAAIEQRADAGSPSAMRVEQRRDEGAEAAEPEMTRLGAAVARSRWSTRAHCSVIDELTRSMIDTLRSHFVSCATLRRR